MADVKKLELLASASVGTLVERASDPVATLRALEGKLEAGLAEAEAAVVALPERLEALEARLEAERTTAAKCDAIVAKSEADGRPELARAAQERKARALEAASAVERDIAEAQSDGGRLDALLPALEERLEDVRARLAELPTAPATDLDAGPAGLTATYQGRDVSASGSNAPPTPEPEPAGAAEGGDDADWENELAALMSSMGVAPTPSAPSAGEDEDDDPMAGIPSLVEVPEDALPEGEELPPEPKAAPAAPAKAQAPAVVQGKGPQPPAPAGKGAAPAAPAGKGAAPAAKAAAKPPAERKGGGAGLWVTLALLAAAAAAVWWFLLRT